MILSTVIAKSAAFKGSVIDPSSRETLVGAVVQLSLSADTLKTYATTTNAAGAFEFANVPPQNYILKITYLGYRHLRQTIAIAEAGTDMGSIRMQREAIDIEAVQVQATGVRATQRGDTTEFNADAYKVAQDATTEDLLKKLPGITVENGTVKTQGEEVKKVLVDGKPFFGDDPTIAIRNLPAEVIDKIEVFNRLSDQAQLTGFDDGEGVQAINIVTKRDRRVGQFGRVYGSGGYDDQQNELRYSAGGNVNFFTPKQRISIIGMSNNVNQQNFAMEEMSALASSSGSGRGGGGMFFGSTAGVATTHMLGINYSDTWGKKTEVTASYFLNYSDKTTDRKIARNYLRTDSIAQQYNSLSNNDAVTQNHRLNLRLDHKFTEKTSLLFDPTVNFSAGDRDNSSTSQMLYDAQERNSADNQSHSDSYNLRLQSGLLLRHQFAKKGRSFSARVRGSFSDENVETNKDNKTRRDSVQDDVLQLSNNPTNDWSLRSNVNYTEPIGEKSLLQIEYNFNYSFGESNKETYNLLKNNQLDSLYSSIYSNNYFTHRAGLSYRYRTDKANASVGLNYQSAELDGTRTMPHAANTSRTFTSLLPNARLEYKFTKQQTLRLFYRTYTNAPSMTQLQDVINNNNSLLISTGNPHLSETRNQMLSLNYNQTTVDKGATFFAMLFGSVTNNYITNSTATIRRDTILSNNRADTVWLREGAQFSQPVNMNGYFNTRAVVNFGIPVALLKSNLNLSTSASYSRQPGLVNGEFRGGQIVNGDINYANDMSLNLGLTLGSNISDRLDFNVGYNATYRNVINTLQQGQNNTYFQHSANARLNWIFWKGFTFYTAANYDQYRGLSDAYNEQFIKMDAGFGKKFWKNQAEIKLMVYDIFNSTNNYSRSVTENYIEDAFTNVLSRYFSLTFTYTLRSFGKPQERPAEEGPRGMPFGAPPGGGGFRP
ncbi:collagen-binding protein [Bacteroidia bacterium]|nr:collagen-binding protein [Bacteroidia bacterium]